MSNLSGMTGFARIAGEAEWGTWAWEAKSVNGRGLDVRVNTPPGFDSLERIVKASATKLFNRGSLQVSLRVEMTETTDTVSINSNLFNALLAAAEEAHGAGVSSEAVATLMTVKGVVETGGSNIRDLANDETVSSMLAQAAERALAELVEARKAEGQVLSGILLRLLDELEATSAHAGTLARSQPALLKVRLSKQLEELDTENRVDAERLAVELALTAAKADVLEELDRLTAHFATGRALLAGGSPVGRKLDFLAQELNRESNTLCSKSVSLDLTNAGLGLKGIVDQFKEQAANVE